MTAVASKNSAAIEAADWAALESFGNGIGVPVPEPAALPLLVLGAGLLLRKRQVLGR